MLADWRYTAARTTDAHKLVERFAAVRRGEAAPADEEEAERPRPNLTSGARAAPARWPCFGCSASPKRRKGLMLLGFVLTLATTAAGLVPPYLTMPLVNEFLQPFEQRARRHRRPLSGSGLARNRSARLRPTQAAEQHRRPAASHDAALVQLQDDQRDHFMKIGWYLAAFAGDGGAGLGCWAGPRAWRWPTSASGSAPICATRPMPI